MNTKFKNIPLSDEGVKYVGELLELVFFDKNIEKAKQLADSIYTYHFDIPEEIEDLVIGYVTEGKEIYINNLALLAIKMSYLETKQHIKLIAILVINDILRLQIVPELILLKYSAEEENSIIQRVFDVAMIVKEDAQEQFLSPEDDSLLIDTLRDALKYLE